MHVLQYIAVKANNSDEAMSDVEHKLTSWLGSDDSPSGVWYDWFVVGGGRFVDGDPYQSSPNHIISFADDRQKFSDKLHEAIATRVAEFKSYRDLYNSKAVDLEAKLDSYTGTIQYDFDLFPLRKMIDMLQGEWDYNSYFFDIQNESTQTEHMEETLGDSWYLVPVDFHF
jgi:hypothetical protein